MSRAGPDSLSNCRRAIRRISRRPKRVPSTLKKRFGGEVQDHSEQRTILIVDDEDGVRESVREVLSDEGYRVVDTPDGTRVLDLIEEEKPRLILLDIWMPQIDGIGLLKDIKAKKP